MEGDNGSRKGKKEKDWNSYRFDTQISRSGEDPYPETSHSLRTPIYATKSYTYNTMEELLKNFYYYSRTENPTLFSLDKKLATLHGGQAALSVASGMAAVHLACSSLLQKRLERKKLSKMKKYMPQSNPDVIPNVLIHTNQYTGIYRLITSIYPQMGIQPRVVDFRDLKQVRDNVDENTRFLLLETPANPNVDIIDIQAISELVHEVGAKCIVDNTWASPALQRPLEHGADLVVESLTKYINGHGDCLGGAIIGSRDAELREIRYYWLETQGAVLSPFNAWLILRGIRTLPLRMEKHSQNALEIARFLEQQPMIENVAYPGLASHPGHEIAKKQMSNFGGMVGFEFKDEAASLKFMDSLKLIKVGVSLGDTTSLVEHTAYMTGVNLAK